MTAYTTYTSGIVAKSTAGSGAASAPMRTVFTNVIDCAQRNLAAADTLVVMTIPANTWGEQCFIEVITIDATQTVDIGDAIDPDGWGVGLSLATAGMVHDPDAAFNAAAALAGKLYTAATDILITVPSGKALDTAKFRIVMPATVLG